MGRAMKTLFLLTTTAAPALAGDEAGASGIQQHLSRLDALFADTVKLLETFLFVDFGSGVPLIVTVLVAGGVYFSFYFGWLSIRGFKHSIDIIRGRYDNPDDPGEISHFQALTSALSATTRARSPTSRPSPAPCRRRSVSATSPASPSP